MKITATDVIGALAIVGGLALKAIGVNGVVDGVIIAIASYYFGRRKDIAARLAEKK